MSGNRIRNDIVAAPPAELAPPRMTESATAGIPAARFNNPGGSAAGEIGGNPFDAPDAHPDFELPQDASALGSQGYATFAARLKSAHDSVGSGREAGPPAAAPGPSKPDIGRLWAVWQRCAC